MTARHLPTPEVKAGAEAFRKRFPLKVNTIPAGIHWDRPAELLLPRFAPRDGRYGSRRSDGILWFTWAREAALGSTITLRTAANGQKRTYPLLATPAEGLAYLEWAAYGVDARGQAYLPAGGARQTLGWVHRVLELNGACGSATGVDPTPLEDPAKVWRCDSCGWRYRGRVVDGITTYVGVR